jgi:hypothetical protein
MAAHAGEHSSCTWVEKRPQAVGLDRGESAHLLEKELTTWRLWPRECLKRLLVSLAFVRCDSGVEAVEFDNDRPLLQSGFVGLNLARGPGHKTPAERLNGWPC